MNGKKILLGITGSIAAYKAPTLVRQLKKVGAEVKVIMTPSSTEFVSPLVLSTLSKNEVLVDISNQNSWANHVMLGRWADLLLIAPASCNTIAKMSTGICDNLLLAVYLSATCPVWVAPAMDEDMWHHASFKRNINTLESWNHIILQSEYGELASGLVGMGRMMEPENIFSSLENYFAQSLSLNGKRALVTAGPTYENLDPVRYIGNHSTGKMGIAIATSLANQGCEVELVLGPTSLNIEHSLIKTTRVTSAEQMFNACTELFDTVDIAIMSAAVADYTPVQVANQKIKKKTDTFTIELTKTKDILKHLGTCKTEKQVLVGFALESENETDYALKKLEEKNADAIVLNSLKDEGAGFGHDTNKVTIFERKGKTTSVPLKSKKEIADILVKKIIEWVKK